jgi:hypothetical protein
MLNDIQITSDYMSRWVVLKRRVGAVTSQRVLKGLFYVNELESLSDWVRTIRSLVQGRIHKLKNCVNSRPKSVFKDKKVVKCLSSLHAKYVIVPATLTQDLGLLLSLSTFWHNLQQHP